MVAFSDTTVPLDKNFRCSWPAKSIIMQNVIKVFCDTCNQRGCFFVYHGLILDPVIAAYVE